MLTIQLTNTKKKNNLLMLTIQLLHVKIQLLHASNEIIIF